MYLVYILKLCNLNMIRDVRTLSTNPYIVIAALENEMILY